MQLDVNEELHEEDLYYTNEVPINDNVDIYLSYKLKITVQDDLSACIR
jgi:hypothetical protein